MGSCWCGWLLSPGHISIPLAPGGIGQITGDGTELGIGAMDPEPQAVAQGISERNGLNNCLANFVPVDLINEIDCWINKLFHFFVGGGGGSRLLCTHCSA